MCPVCGNTNEPDAPTCDMCGQGMDGGTRLYGCRICNHDACAACYATLPAVAPAAPVHPACGPPIIEAFRQHGEHDSLLLAVTCTSDVDGLVSMQSVPVDANGTRLSLRPAPPEWPEPAQPAMSQGVILCVSPTLDVGQGVFLYASPKQDV